MQKEGFKLIFNQTITCISDDWKNKYSELLNAEHWDLIGDRVFSFVVENKFHQILLPAFEEEIITELDQHYRHFEKLKSILDKPGDEKIQLLAKTIETVPIESFLIILGQRKTSASVRDEGGIPPPKEQLLESSFKPYNDQVSKAARAREKHVSRNQVQTFWGTIEGSTKKKEELTRSVILKIMEEKTWWNVFTHYKHGVVYEIRVASGEGIRWRKEDLKLIGFLEPFI